MCWCRNFCYFCKISLLKTPFSNVGAVVLEPGFPFIIQIDSLINWLEMRPEVPIRSRRSLYSNLASIRRPGIPLEWTFLFPTFQLPPPNHCRPLQHAVLLATFMKLTISFFRRKISQNKFARVLIQAFARVPLKQLSNATAGFGSFRVNQCPAKICCY